MAGGQTREGASFGASDPPPQLRVECGRAVSSGAMNQIYSIPYFQQISNAVNPDKIFIFSRIPYTVYRSRRGAVVAQMINFNL